MMRAALFCSLEMRSIFAVVVAPHVLHPIYMIFAPSNLVYAIVDICNAAWPNFIMNAILSFTNTSQKIHHTFLV